MAQLLAMSGFVAVLLRAATLCFQSLVIGGVVFAVAVAPTAGSRSETIEQRVRRLIAASAISLALTQTISAAWTGFFLMQSADLTLRETIGANFILTAGVCVCACLAILAGSAGGWRRNPVMLIPAAVIIATSVISSHAASSMTHQILLGLFTALHQGATAAWIGGLPYLWMALKSSPDSQTTRKLVQRFSNLAMASVATLGAAGLGLGLAYVGSWQGLYGTSYGAMVGAKILLFACLLALGGLNFQIVRRLRNDDGSLLFDLRRFVEVEIGFGVIVILAAASLTSQPPAVDLIAGRVSSTDIVARLTPRWPQMRTPDFHELAYFVAQRQAQSAPTSSTNPGAQPDAQPAETFNNLADHEWSEYNHHWAGLVVLLVGLMALIANTGHAQWARNWPLLFFLLAAFLFLRADAENWPLGPKSFWMSFSDPEVLQHRMAVLLIIIFAIFEWRVRTGRTTSETAALVFPAVCALGGAVLLTHSHALRNIKEELLAEYSHLPLAILAVVAGCSRWLEVRLPGGDRVRPFLSWVWPICFVLVGALLLGYREI